MNMQKISAISLLLFFLLIFIMIAIQYWQYALCLLIGELSGFIIAAILSGSKVGSLYQDIEMLKEALRRADVDEPKLWSTGI